MRLEEPPNTTEHSCRVLRRDWRVGQAKFSDQFGSPIDPDAGRVPAALQIRNDLQHLLEHIRLVGVCAVADDKAPVICESEALGIAGLCGDDGAWGACGNLVERRETREPASRQEAVDL